MFPVYFFFLIFDSFIFSGAQDGKKCPNNPFVIVPEETVYIDQQVLKLQDNPESVPAGEMPRHLDLVVDR